MAKVRSESVTATVLKWACALVVSAILVYTLMDYGASGEDYMTGYLQLCAGSPTNAKATFLIQYQADIERQMQEETVVDGFSNLYTGDIDISTEIFPELAVRLNTEIYAETAAVLAMFNTDEYFGNQESARPLVSSLREELNPMQVLCLAASESGNWSDRKYNWVPAIFSKGMSEGDLENVHIQDIDSKFYINNEKFDYFRCGSSEDSHVSGGCKLHYGRVEGHTYNDADSLGPMQVLRRYMDVDAYNSEQPYMSVYHLNIPLGSEDEYCITDLMGWSDSIAWTINHFLLNVKSAYGSQKENVLENEYEVMCLFAITHNTGAGFLSSSDGSFSGWADKEAIFRFCKDITSPEAITYLMLEYIDPWYEDAKEKITEGSGWELPGNENLESSGSHKDDVMKKLLKTVGATGLDEESTRLDCEYWVGESRGLDSDHKFRYPVKTLLNYLALQKLYYSGLEE